MGQTKKYLQKLYRQSVEDVRRDFGTKGAPVILALKIVLAAIGIGLFTSLQLLPNNEPIYKTVWAAFAGDILGLLALFIATPIVAVLRIPQAAAQNDNKQTESIKEQYSRISKLRALALAETIKTTQIKFKQIDEPPPYRDEDGYYIVYLEISNGEGYDLRNCFVNLESLNISDDGKKWINWLKYSTRNTTYLQWVNFGKDDEKIIRRTKSEKILVARMRPKDYPHHAVPLVPHLMYADGTDERLLYHFINLQISLNGELSKNGKLIPIDEVVFNGFLKIEQSNLIQEGATHTTIRGGVRIEEKDPPIKILYRRLWLQPGELSDDQTT